jgi:hypothetical protein
MVEVDGAKRLNQAKRCRPCVSAGFGPGLASVEGQIDSQTPRGFSRATLQRGEEGVEGIRGGRAGCLPDTEKPST